ncbi:MAG: hypothetical protein ACREYE_31535, partial [Gammaproteobacteria bacterium]
GHHQEDRAGAGQDGADQAQIHPAPREKEGGLTVKLFKGHYTSAAQTMSSRRLPGAEVDERDRRKVRRIGQQSTEGLREVGEQVRRARPVLS